MHDYWLLVAMSGLFAILSVLTLAMAYLAYSRLERAIWVAASAVAVVASLATYYWQPQLALAAWLLFAGLYLFGYREDRRHREVTA